MRAAVIYEHGDLDAIVVESRFPDPEPAAGEVLVRVRSVSLNYHDIFTRRGMPGIRINFPMITGSDVAGDIGSVGDDVTDWREGDRVLIEPVLSNSARFGMIGETVHGGKAEYLCVPAEQLIRIPDTVSYDDAAALPLAYATAHRMMTSRGAVRESEKVMILGASGGVGVACVQLAKRAGAEVVACASSDEKLARLRELGADHVINYSARPFEEQLQDIWGRPKISGDGGADVVVNFTGGDTWIPSLRCVTKRGRVLTCGATAGYGPPTDLRFIWTFEQTIIGSNGWRRADLDALLALVKSGELRPEIDRCFPLEQCRDAEALLEERKVLGKVLINP